MKSSKVREKSKFPWRRLPSWPWAVPWGVGVAEGGLDGLGQFIDRGVGVVVSSNLFKRVPGVAGDQIRDLVDLCDILGGVALQFVGQAVEEGVQVLLSAMAAGPVRDGDGSSTTPPCGASSQGKNGGLVFHQYLVFGVIVELEGGEGIASPPVCRKVIGVEGSLVRDRSILLGHGLVDLAY